MCGVSVQVSALVSETRSHWALGSLNGPRWSVSEPQGPAVSVSPGLGLRTLPPHPGFYMNARDQTQILLFTQQALYH